MENITVKYLSTEPHVSQILTGFCTLPGQKYKVTVENHANDARYAYHCALVEVTYRGKTILYDTMDGYQYADAIQFFLQNCDFYFKRSFSEQKNEALHLKFAEKMYPLGFNYHVSCRKHPLDKPYWKETIKRAIGLEYNAYSNTSFSNRAFEEIPAYKKSGFRVLFATRLWEQNAGLSPELNAERQYINETRIDIIRRLKAFPEIQFVGGVTANTLAKEIAPDLILASSLTGRRNYLKLMHSCDICIGTMGLHESIGWKTGEYVAAAKAIVNERLHYTVPGHFSSGRNYLEFRTGDECVEAVQSLVGSPEKLYKMKCANREYYCNYLKPNVMIQNTLNIVDSVF